MTEIEVEKRFPERIKMLRGEMRYAEFGVICGNISAKMIRNYEEGTSEPTRQKLIQIATGYNEHIAPDKKISIGWLTAGEGEMYLDPIATAAIQARKDLTQEGVIQEGVILSTIEPGQPEKKKKVLKQRLNGQNITEADKKLTKLLDLTVKVLQSDTPYNPALSANIKAFAEAVDNESKLIDVTDKLAAMDKRLAELEKNQQGGASATA